MCEFPDSERIEVLYEKMNWAQIVQIMNHKAQDFWLQYGNHPNLK